MSIIKTLVQYILTAPWPSFHPVEACSVCCCRDMAALGQVNMAVKAVRSFDPSCHS